MTNLTDLARHWLNQTAKGKGMRLSAEELDLLNAIGVGEIIAAEAAKHLREQCQERTLQPTRGEGETKPVPPPSSSSPAPSGGSNGEARARQMFG